MKGKQIIVVDDDPGILRLIAANLDARGYETLSFSTGSLALAQMERTKPDLVILDILLPGIDGIELVGRIREMSRVPIMMISGKTEVTSKLEALDLGADDYLTKPFNIEELIARVRAILRRSDSPIHLHEGTETYNYGELTVDLDKSEVVRCGKPIKLSAREWSVLRTFIKNMDRIVTQRTLLQQVWGPEYGDEGDYVRTYVTRLRKNWSRCRTNPNIS